MFSSADEQQPLVHSKMHSSSMNKACTLVVVGALVCGWCILDSWRHDASAQLFGMSNGVTMQYPTTNSLEGLLKSLMTAEVSHPFVYPLTLAFFQFAFMGMIFLAVWYAVTRNAAADAAVLRKNLFSPQWTGLVATHVFSTFWLQSLMMPMQLMSPAVFAASRALQVPAAAGFRSKIMDARNCGHAMPTTALMFGAATLLIYSQFQIAECLCIWSGHGIELAGIALVVIYVLVLVVPAANAVCMESVTVDLEMNPILMLAVMNILACALCMPILAFAHFTGWENVIMAFSVTTGSRELSLVVLWLGVQMVLFAAVSFALIAMTDSFWAVALTISFKSVFWWVSSLMHMYLSCPLTNVSANNPHASQWGFIMLLGCVLVGVAAVTDASTPQEPRKAAGDITKAEAQKV